ncbi:hypothetical protein SprV_0802635800 [Sparganum proliferum]
MSTVPTDIQRKEKPPRIQYITDAAHPPSPKQLRAEPPAHPPMTSKLPPLRRPTTTSTTSVVPTTITSTNSETTPRGRHQPQPQPPSPQQPPAPAMSTLSQPSSTAITPPHHASVWSVISESNALRQANQG